MRTDAYKERYDVMRRCYSVSQSVADCRVNPDLVMIVDRSGSIERTDFELVKAFIVDLILDTNIDTGEARVGLLAYSDDVDVVFQVSSAQLAFCIRTVTYTKCQV